MIKGIVSAKYTTSCVIPFCMTLLWPFLFKTDQFLYGLNEINEHPTKENIMCEYQTKNCATCFSVYMRRLRSITLINGTVTVALILLCAEHFVSADTSDGAIHYIVDITHRLTNLFRSRILNITRGVIINQ